MVGREVVLELGGSPEDRVGNTSSGAPAQGAVSVPEYHLQHSWQRVV